MRADGSASSTAPNHRCVLGCRAVQCKIKLFANVVVEGLWKRVHANDQRAKISIRQEQIDWPNIAVALADKQFLWPASALVCLVFSLS